MTFISCTCQPRIAIENHRAGLRSIWRSRVWRKASGDYKARHPAKCSRCGKEGPIVPGHSGEDYSPEMTESYIQKVRDDQVVPLCPRCNQQEAKGKHPCPSCIAKHAADPEHWIRYIGQDQEICFHCEHPEKRKRERPTRHPCLCNIGQQRCRRNGQVLVCPYPPRTAQQRCDPDHFVARKKEGVAS
jgi:hypothetical protein